MIEWKSRRGDSPEVAGTKLTERSVSGEKWADRFVVNVEGLMRE